MCFLFPQDALTEKLKEQQELDKKLTKLARELECYERACREEEVKYIQEYYEKRKVEDREFHEEVAC